MAKKKQRHKYHCFAKIANNPDGSAKMITHHTSDLLKYVQFITAKFPSWTWFNVYSNDGLDKGIKLRSFSKFNLPSFKNI